MVFYAIVDILSMKNSLKDRLNWRKERIYGYCVKTYVTEIEKKERYSDTIVFNPKKQVSVRSISHEKYNRRNEISPAFM